jgi:uncharacterized protein with NRDE domain
MFNIFFSKNCHLWQVEKTRNEWCVSNATMVMQMYHIVKLYVHCLSCVLLLALCEVSNSFMNMSWEKIVLFKDAINVKIM